jgi:hypothetical protein
MTKQGHEVRSFYREHDLMLAPEERARARGLTYSGTDLPARSHGVAGRNGAPDAHLDGDVPCGKGREDMLATLRPSRLGDEPCCNTLVPFLHGLRPVF